MTWLRPLLLAISLIPGFMAQAAEVQISGASPAEINRLRRDLPEAFEGELKLSEVDEVIRALANTNLYERVVAERTKDGGIVVIVKPLRTIQELKITGNQVFGSRELLDVIGLKPKERFDRKRVVEAGERLKNFYGERGFFNTVIEVSFDKHRDGGLAVSFLVKEGPPTIVKGITIQCDNKELVDRLGRLVGRYVKRPLTTTDVESMGQKVRDFLRDRRYLRSDFVGPEAKYNKEKTEAWLTYRLTEPYRYEFIVQGADRMSESEVYRNLSTSTLERGTSDPAIEAVERIRQGYLRLGYPNVEVTSKVVEMKDDFVRRVRLEVKENEQVKIVEIAINGRISRPNSYYEKFIRSNSSSLIYRGFYNRQDLEKGFANLITELRNQGYLKAKIQSSRLEILDRPGLARVVVVMDEGPLTQIRSVGFTGNEAFSAEVLQGVLSVKANSPLRLNQLEQSLEELKTFYQNQGYLEFRVMNEGEELIQYNEKGTHADIRFDLFEGPRVVVHSIAVEGNSFTKADVILRSIDIQPGQVLTPAKIETSEERLNRLGIFARATVRTVEEGTNVSDRTVMVSVVERDPGSFRMGAGVNNERGLTLRGFTGLAYSNLMGTARGVSARAEVKSHVVEVNYPQYEVVASYLEPFLFNTSSRGRLNLTRSERIFEFDSGNGATKITASNKVDLFIDHDFSKHVLFSWKAYSMDARRQFERYGRCIDQPTFNPSKYCDPTVQQIFTMGPILDLDFRDNPQSPTRGNRTIFNLDYSDPLFGSSRGIQFVRMELGHTKLTPLGGARKIWANSLRGGYEANLSRLPGSGIPTSHAFFLGGFSTVRGYGGTGVSERIPGTELPVQNGNQLLIHTDSHYVLFKSEFQFPIVGEHGVALFYDGGMVKITGYDFKKPWRDAAGFGYRYNTPVGPLSVDIGFKLNRDPDQEKFRVHFSVGTF